jgi:SAM-dependent methyltransferase
MKICPACRTRFAAADWSCPFCRWEAPRTGPVPAMTSAAVVDGFSATSFEPLAALEDHHFWFKARNALITWAVSRYFPGARTVLDVGCGNGQVSRALQRAFPNLRLTACEAFLEGLAIAARKVPSAELVQADIRDLPWSDEFDVVGAFDVLEHVTDDGAALRQMVQATRPHGGVIVTVPQHQWLWSPIDDYSRHVRRYSRVELRSRLEAAGLRVERITSFVSVPLPLLLVSRMSKRGEPIDPMAEFNISPLANAGGAALMAVERLMIRAGVPLPAGGSLLAVGRRSDV